MGRARAVLCCLGGFDVQLAVRYELHMLVHQNVGSKERGRETRETRERKRQMIGAIGFRHRCPLATACDAGSLLFLFLFSFVARVSSHFIGKARLSSGNR